MSFAEREEVALLKAQDKGAREIARKIGRDPGTVSRELRRNAATRGGKPVYRAVVVQWKAQQAAKRPKTAKLVLHIETSRGVPRQTAQALESIGYRLLDAVDPRDTTAHRFVRGKHRVDVVASEAEVVDVLRADHPAPKVVERLRGREMVAIEGDPSTATYGQRPTGD